MARLFKSSPTRSYNTIGEEDDADDGEIESTLYVPMRNADNTTLYILSYHATAKDTP